MRTQMAMQAFQAGHLDEAEKLCRQALNADPRDADATRLLIRVYDHQDDTAALVDMLDAVLAAMPDADIVFRLGARLRDHGCFDAARRAFRAVVRLDPERTDAYYSLTLITRYRARDPEVTAMEELYARTAPDSRQRRQLGFALGKVFDDLGDYDRAFGYFATANDIAYSAAGYSVQNDIRYFGRIAETFDAGFFARHRGHGDPSAKPIIILGMPRSGTTLVEQILASHPDVHASGERPIVPDWVTRLANAVGAGFPDGFARVGGDVLATHARKLAAQFDALAPERARVTNKSITNFMYLGLLRVLLPNATIIECRRDPRDQALSIYQKDLHEQPYGYDLAAIGYAYRLYRALLAHWERLLPADIGRVTYEDLVTEPEPRVRELLRHCGLPWSDACLEFHQTRRAVRTVSTMQVRRPMYTDSIGRWKRYEQHLGPLFAVLGPELDRSG